MTDMYKMIKEIRETNAKNWELFQEVPDWFDSNYRVPAALALIHSEVSEGLEAFREDDVENFKEEMADVVIRVLDLMGGFANTDFPQIIWDKINANKKRPYKHGGKRL